jgi:DNA-binding IclR family transcriptional regulator
VLLCVASDPELPVSEIAGRVGITDRRVHAILTDLVGAGYLQRTRKGRHNHYEVDGTRPLRHLQTEHKQLGDLIAVLQSVDSIDGR